MGFLFTNVAYAAGGESLDQFISNVDKLIINPLIILLFALALLYFLWGLYNFISNQDNEEKKSEGKQSMIWGVIGITIMMGVWTLLNIVLNTFGINGIVPEKGTVNLPTYTPPPSSGLLKIN